MTNEKANRLAVNSSLGHYLILRSLGAGGMGEVYLAEDARLRRKIALKVLSADAAANTQYLQRFEQEAFAASALNHPNILTIYEIGEADNTHFIVTEYVEGETLREHLKRRSLNLSETLDIALQIASALVAAHNAKIVHRDIKPENIMIRPDGFVKILDFGLAKLVEQKPIGTEESTIKQHETSKGVILGTVNYMSPEQAKGEKIDERTDIFSFGAVLYEMISGRTPFAGKSLSETLANLINQEPQPLSRFAADVPDELQKIVSKALRKNVDERYQTMKGLLADLKELRENLAFSEKLEKSRSPEEENETQKYRATTQAGQAKILTNDKNSTQPENRRNIFFAVALIVLFAVFGVWYFSSRTTDSKQIESIAVLPFQNESGNAEIEYLSDGMTETLIGNLSNIIKLNVKARSSVFRYKGQEASKKIAEELNVQAILTGRVIQRGDDLTLFLNLVDGKTENNLWSKQYNRKLSNLVALQTEIARDVAESLKAKLSGAETQKFSRNYTENAEAYQLYLKGRFHTSKVTPAEVQRGIAYFQEAIQLDPNYALAYAGLADAYRTIPLGPELSPTEYFPKAKEMARKALEIDETLAEAYAALGSVAFWFDWDWTASENYCQKALAFNPNSADARITYAHLLSNIGRHAEALEQAKRARELDPLNVRVNFLEAQFLLHAGQIDESFARLEKAYELDSNFIGYYQFMPSVLIEKGKFAEAIVLSRKGLELHPNNSRIPAFLGYALAKTGNRAEAEAIAEKLVKTSNERFVSAQNIALLYNGLGETAKSLEWLNRGIEQRDPRMTFLKVEPKWNNLRGDARFQEIMRRMNFP